MLREPEGRYDPLSTCPKCGASGELVETRYCEGGRPRAFSEPELHALTDAVAILSLVPGGIRFAGLVFEHADRPSSWLDRKDERWSVTCATRHAGGRCG